MIPTEPRPDLEADFAAMLVECRQAGAFRAEELAAPGPEPSTEYWFQSEAGGGLLGAARLRPRLLPPSPLHRGHVTYVVRPLARGQGLGTELIGHLVSLARGQGMARLLVTCPAGNEAAARAIERNGGRLESLADDEAGHQVRRYWIEFDRGGLGPLLLGDLPQGLPILEESREALVDLRGLHPRLLVDESRREIASRSPGFTRAREGVAAALARACEALPPGRALVLKEAYRPPARQRLSWEACLEATRRANPLAGDEELHRLTCQYVAPPALAGHPTGAALDLTLAVEGLEADLGTAFNAEPLASGRRTFFDSTDIGDEARSHRRSLAAALEGAGFVNYPSEWWHWSLGDPYWAFVTGKPVRYGPLEEEG